MVDYASGFRGRYLHFLAVPDEQVYSAGPELWRQTLDDQPTHSEVKVLKQSPPFLSMLDLVSAKYVSSERAPDKSIQCQNTSGLCKKDMLWFEK